MLEKILNHKNKNMVSAQDDGLQKMLLGPLQDFLQRPGKRLRADLVKVGFEVNLESVEARGGPAAIADRRKALDKMADLTELIHAGSLIVDDIQDGGAFRRGGPSFHVAEGVPQSINSGTWLYFHALKEVGELAVSADCRKDLLQEAIDCLYFGHMGQSLDLSARMNELPQEQVVDRVRQTLKLKTGALAAHAMVSGALLAGSSKVQLQIWRKAGLEFGVLLQLYNDLKCLRDLAEEGWVELRRFRPHFLWWVAAESWSGATYEKLKKAVLLLPDQKRFQSLLVNHNFYESAEKILDRQRRATLEPLNKIRDKMNSKKATQALERLITKMDEDYENKNFKNGHSKNK